MSNEYPYVIEGQHIGPMVKSTPNLIEKSSKNFNRSIMNNPILMSPQLANNHNNLWKV